MKTVEEMMGWKRPDNLVSESRRWVNHLGEYSRSASVDDMLSWFHSQDFILTECYWSPLNREFVISLLSARSQIAAHGATMYIALANAVRSWTEI
jgi:hypothetical protein